MGDPATELVRVATSCAADLIAMSTHGHKGLSDVIHGATADRVRHEVRIPVLLLRAQGGPFRPAGDSRPEEDNLDFGFSMPAPLEPR